MSNDMECPYCGADQEVCHDDDGSGYSQDEAHEQQCSHCEKTFVFYTTISFSYSPKKADCLNGGNHRWKITSTFPRIYSKMRCLDCEGSRFLTEDELTAHGIDYAEKTKGGE